jgi:predicted small integral membrane protein
MASIARHHRGSWMASSWNTSMIYGTFFNIMLRCITLFIEIKSHVQNPLGFEHG